MNIHHLEISVKEDQKLYTSISKHNILISEIETKNIPEEVCYKVNYQIDKINSINGESEEQIKKQLEITFKKILNILEQDLGIIPQNYYRNMWLALGMSVFGLPLGVLIATFSSNISYLVFGMLIGMIAGLAYGSKKDQDALKENKVIILKQD